MDFQYSPHRQALHLSPTHPHGFGADHLASITDDYIRRSLSRSPSRPSRFLLHTNSPNSPRSPISPLATSRAFSPRNAADGVRPLSFQNISPPSQQTHVAPSSARKIKQSVIRRTPNFRASPRRRTSPRRPLGESVGHANTLPIRPGSGCPPSQLSKFAPEKFETEPKMGPRGGINDEPIKFSFARAKPEGTASHVQTPARSTPLKRSDGIMNLDQASLGSPVAKRRSFHGASMGNNFNIFDHGPDAEHGSAGNAVSSPGPSRSSSLRNKSSSLRKSTLQRGAPAPSRPSRAPEHEFAKPSQAASLSRSRLSWDSTTSSNFVTSSSPNPFRSSTQSEPQAVEQATPARPNFSRSTTIRPLPHPLSNALTPSSSSSSLQEDDSPTHAPVISHNYTHVPVVFDKEDRQPYHAPSAEPRQHSLFSKSLPLGAQRPQEDEGSPDFATPAVMKGNKRGPDLFMSTGLISKKNRKNVMAAEQTYVMPETPSKRASYPPVTATPRHRILADAYGAHEAGTPPSPFSPHMVNVSPRGFGKGMGFLKSILAAKSTMSPRRRASVSSFDEECPNSPSRLASQSSMEDLPPTPTKGGNDKERKDSSLRSSLLGRRTSMGRHTFTPPVADDHASSHRPKISPSNSEYGRDPPHTPLESCQPPDPSTLSISNHAPRRESLGFGNSTNSLYTFPPATPTASRDNGFFDRSHFGVIDNEHDASLAARFQKFKNIGKGVFSQVFRVESPINNGSFTPPSHNRGIGQVWAVKRSKQEIRGQAERKTKYREVQVLKLLRDIGGHENVVNYVDSWEYQLRLYIQTDFCENGDMKAWLEEQGNIGRLDDFRIWKIFLELTRGVQFIHDSGCIHLDLKPANVLIDWEGVLKIADFGMACEWPAPKGIEGEGDRNYMAPEQLDGFHDRPADIFSLGLMMMEIAGNIVLPDYGDEWQRLRHDDYRDLPLHTWSSESDLTRDDSGNTWLSTSSTAFEFDSMTEFDSSSSLFPRKSKGQSENLTQPPVFMTDPEHPDSFGVLLRLLTSSHPEERPTVDQVYRTGGIQWVAGRRRAGATVYEGPWGPADYVLNYHDDVDMVDV